MIALAQTRLDRLSAHLHSFANSEAHQDQKRAKATRNEQNEFVALSEIRGDSTLSSWLAGQQNRAVIKKYINQK